MSTLAGSAGNPGNGNGTGTNALFYEPEGIAVTADGSLLFVADTWNHTIRQITTAGVVNTLAGTPGTSGTNNGTGGAALFYQPAGLAVDGSGNVYVADTANATIRVITPGGVVTNLAGTPGVYGSANGSGSGAQFYQPAGVALDASGNVYVADTFNHTVRRVTPGGATTLFAGGPGVFGSADGGTGAARFCAPQGLAVSGTNIYVADTGNSAIRQISGGSVVTFAGFASTGSADGTNAAAQFYWPQGAAVDGAGNTYVGDTFNHTIRKISVSGVVSTIAGSAGNSGTNARNGGGQPGEPVCG